MWRKTPCLVPRCINSYCHARWVPDSRAFCSDSWAHLFSLEPQRRMIPLPDSIIAFSRVPIIDTGLPMLAWCNNDDARVDCVVMTNRSHSKVLLLFYYVSKIVAWSSKWLKKRGRLNSVLLLWFHGISFAIAVVSPRGVGPGDLSAGHRVLIHCLRRVLVSTEICTFPVHICHPRVEGRVCGWGWLTVPRCCSSTPYTICSGCQRARWKLIQWLLAP